MSKSESNKYILFFSFCVLLMIFYYCGIHIYDKSSIFKLLIVFVLLIAVFTLSISVAYGRNKMLEKAVLSFVIILGIFYAFIVPPLRVTDEQTHYARVYSITEGNIIAPSNGDTVTSELNTFISEVGDFTNEFTIQNYKNSVSTILNSRDIKISDYLVVYGKNASSYSIINYIPHIGALLICKAFHTSVLFSIYLGRIFSVLFFAFSVYISLKLLPCMKITMSIFILNPMLLHQVAGYSSESVNIALVILTLSLILNIKNQNGKISNKNFYILLALLLMLGFAKPPYLLISFMILIIPKNKWNDHGWLKIGLLLITPILAMALWQGLSGGVTNVTQRDNNYSLSYILQNPLNSTYLIAYNLLRRFNDIIYMGLIGIFGGALGIPNFFVIIPLYLLIIALIENNEMSERSNYKINIVLIITIGILIGAVLLVMMLWTEKGTIIFSGLQGRYFLPVFPLALYFINLNKKISNEYKNFSTRAILLQVTFTLIVSISVIEGYYLR